MKASKQANQSLQFNKANFQMLEQERNMLKITLQHVTAQNDKLRNELEDMKMTAKQNKELLREYVEKITNKDKVFEKMNAQIEQLTNRLKILENYNKSKPTSPMNDRSGGKRRIKEEFNGNGSGSGSGCNNNNNNNHNTTTNSNNTKTNPNLSSTLPTSNKTTSNPNHMLIKDESKQQGQQLQQGQIQPISQQQLQQQQQQQVISNNTNNNNTTINNNTSISNNISSSNSNCNSHNNSTIIHNSNTISLKKNDEKMKEFISRQSALIEEMSSLKDDIQFILENKTKSKLRDKLNQSISSSGNQSLNSSVIHSQSQSSYISNKNNINDDSSILNNSIISNVSTQTVKKKINLKDRFHLTGNLTDFLTNYNQLKNLLFLIDNRGVVWELIKRLDINPNVITSNPYSMKSVLCCDRSMDDKLHNIEIRDPFDNHSLAASEEEFGKYSDFNISKYIKEID